MPDRILTEVEPGSAVSVLTMLATRPAVVGLESGTHSDNDASRYRVDHGVFGVRGEERFEEASELCGRNSGPPVAEFPETDENCRADWTRHTVRR